MPFCRECKRLGINRGYPTRALVSAADKDFQMRGAYGLNQAETHLILKHREMSSERDARKERISVVIVQHLAGRHIKGWVNSNFEVRGSVAKFEADRLAEKIVDVI